MPPRPRRLLPLDPLEVAASVQERLGMRHVDPPPPSPLDDLPLDPLDDLDTTRAIIGSHPRR